MKSDIQNGPDQAVGAMAILTAMLYERYKAGRYPLALVSMDNCSQNGARLRESVLCMAEEWQKADFVDAGFVDYVSDENVIRLCEIVKTHGLQYAKENTGILKRLSYKNWY